MKTSSPFRSAFSALVRSEVFAAAYWVGAFALIVVFGYFQWFGQELKFPLSKDPAVWGQFGDYIGGVLNPICAYMAFVWLVRSYALQKTELVETRKGLEEGKKAQEEQARLALLSAQTQSLSIRLTGIGSTLSALRSSHARAIEHANLRGLDYAIVADDGTYKTASVAIPALYALIKVAEKAEAEIIAELNKMALHGTQTENEVQSEISK